MSVGDVKIVRNQDRFKGAPEQDYLLQIALEEQSREIIEGDKNVYLSQESQFEEERQSSNVFRISGKIVNIFDNGISGFTSYTPYGNNLFYINGIEAKQINANQNPVMFALIGRVVFYRQKLKAKSRLYLKKAKP